MHARIGRKARIRREEIDSRQENAFAELLDLQAGGPAILGLTTATKQFSNSFGNATHSYTSFVLEASGGGRLHHARPTQVASAQIEARCYRQRNETSRKCKRRRSDPSLTLPARYGRPFASVFAAHVTGIARGLICDFEVGRFQAHMALLT